MPESVEKVRTAIQSRRFQPLRRAVKVPVWGDLGIRLGLAFILIMTVVLIHYWDRDGLIDNHDGHVSFLDVVYFTMISITTTGFGDIAPISERARLVEALIVTPVRFAVLFIFVGTAYNFLIKRSWEKFRMARIQDSLEDHVVVLGFGISGSEAVGELIEHVGRAAGRKVIRVPVPRIATKFALQYVPGCYRLTQIPAAVVDYFVHPTVYTCVNTLADLEGSGVKVPSFASYVDRIVDFVQRHPTLGPDAKAG